MGGSPALSFNKPLVISSQKSLRCEKPHARTHSRGFRQVLWSVLSKGKQTGVWKYITILGGRTLEKIA
jgi:hypothetical protein